MYVCIHNKNICPLFSNVVCILIQTKKLYCIITFCSYRSDVAEIEPALELLNTHGADFDMVEVAMHLIIDYYIVPPQMTWYLEQSCIYQSK